MADTAEEIAALRSVVREAHEAIQDLRHLIRQAQDLKKLLLQETVSTASQYVGEEIAKVNGLFEEVDEAIAARLDEGVSILRTLNDAGEEALGLLRRQVRP